MIVLLSFGAVFAQSQSSAADLTGTVVDPNGAVVAGATVTAKDSATGITRTVTADDRRRITDLSVCRRAIMKSRRKPVTFKKTVISPVKLTVGQTAST